MTTILGSSHLLTLPFCTSNC